MPRISIRPCFYTILLALSLVMLSGCATNNGGSLFPLQANNQKEKDEWQNDEPLFINWLPELASITNNQVDLLLGQLGDGEAELVGQLPGQRELPAHLYTEVAIPHNAIDEGTLFFVKDDTPTDLWERIRRGFTLQHEHAGNKADLRWYVRHQSYIDRVGTRAEPYLHLIVEEAEKQGVPLEIALLPIVESAFQPFAYSHGRAAGIWQFIPSTGRLYGLKQNWWYDGRRDVLASTKAAIKMLKRLNRSFKGDWLLALAAYNSGQGTVSKAIRKNKRKGRPTDFWSLDLPKETRGYVPKLLAISAIIENPAKYNITVKPIANKPYLAKVETKSQIDLALAAELSELSIEELYLLNPAFNRWATDPDGPHHLLLPIAKSDIFKRNLAALPEKERVKWARHKIKKGESLLSIADKYNTTASLIKDVNNIRGNMIRQGQGLVIPVAVKSKSQYKLSSTQRLKSLQNTRRKGKEKIVYRVRKGDTLWDISRKHKIGVRALAKWNGLAPRDTLKTGQKLVIWTKQGRLAKASRDSFSPHASGLVTKKIGYRVRRGDSIALIARKFNIGMNDIIRWNGIKKEKYLQPGQRLTLYINVTQQAAGV